MVSEEGGGPRPTGTDSLWGDAARAHRQSAGVPVAISSTHVAMSVLRMEPVWMTTGQIAGLAAATARETSCDVARLDPTPLPKVLKIRTEPEV